MQNFGNIQQNMNEAAHQMNMQMSYGKFPVPITANPPRKQRNNKKVLAAQPTPPQQQQQLRLLQQPQQLQQFQQGPQQPPQPPPPLQQMDQLAQMAPNQMGPAPIAPVQMGTAAIGPSQIQQRKAQQMRNMQPNVKAPPPQQAQQKLDKETFYILCESLCSFSWMDSVETEWIGEKENPYVVECINNADDTETDLDFNSIQDYINISNNLIRKK